MSNDQFTKVGLALAGLLVAVGTFSAGFYNGQGLSAESQSAAVLNAANTAQAMPAVTMLRPEEVTRLRAFLATLGEVKRVEGEKPMMAKPAVGVVSSTATTERKPDAPTGDNRTDRERFCDNLATFCNKAIDLEKQSCYMRCGYKEFDLIGSQEYYISNDFQECKSKCDNAFVTNQGVCKAVVAACKSS